MLNEPRLIRNFGTIGAIIIALLPFSLHADVTIGAYATGNCYPFMCNDTGVSSGPDILYQQLYSSTAFSGPLSISSLTFFYDSVDGGNSTVLNGIYDFSLSTSSASINNLSTNLSENVGSEAAEFYTGNLGQSYTDSFVVTGTPFMYDPMQGNLLLAISVTDQDDAPDGFSNGYNQADAGSLVVSRAYNLNDADGTRYADNGGLVTTFASATPEPNLTMLLGMGLVGLAGISKLIARPRLRRRSR